MSAMQPSQLRHAAEDIYGILQKCEYALDAVSLKLDGEFSARFSNSGLNPLLLSKRIKQLSVQLPALKADCQALIQRKQALIDATKQQLLANRTLLMDMSSKLGVQQNEDEAATVLEDFTEALTEWDSHAHMQCREIAGEPSYMSRKELNMALAGSMLS